LTDDIVENILKERYYQPGETCWEDIAKRVSSALFDDMNEKSECELCEKYLNDKVLIFNSPTLMNAGTEIGQLSACFTLPIKDDMSDIYDTIRKSALIFQSGGGVGINWSTLRPEGAPVGKYIVSNKPKKIDYGEEHFSNYMHYTSPITGIKTASGPIAFMKSFDSMVETVKSAGKRRGAAIAILNCDHPDIFKFIKSKNEEGKLPNFNISVMITDAFMTAVSLNHEWDLQFDGKIYETIKARDLFNEICKSAWTRAEPGVLFYDTINLNNPMKEEFGDITTVNPCSEQPLCVDFKTGGGEACVLGSIDVSKFTDDNGFIDYIGLEEVIKFAVRALDRIVDVNKYPLPEIRDCVMKGRKIGLGIMGFADTLLKKGISYGSEESLDFIDQLMQTMREIANNESIRIGNGKKKNACTLTVPPTGTIALFANCSSGIEPNFGWVYNRSTWVDGEKKTYRMVHPLFKSHFKDHFDYDILLDYVEKNGTLKGYANKSAQDIKVFCVAKDIPPLDHVKVQARFQKYVDASISKTINCPNSTTVEDIYDIYMDAWISGCKGITIYREGSRNDVVLETAHKTETPNVVDIKNPVQYALLTAKSGRILPKTPKSMVGVFEKRRSGCGKLYVAIGESEGRPHSIIIENSDSGGCTSSQKAIARLVALAFRWKIPLFDVVNSLNVKCDVALKNKNADGKSCAAIIGNIISENYPIDDMPSKDDVVEEVPVNKPKGMLCPECGESLIMTEGCMTCRNCSYSKCN
jgi:ribonucleoside-diphosphate reductase alpha chain